MHDFPRVSASGSEPSVFEAAGAGGPWLSNARENVADTTRAANPVSMPTPMRRRAALYFATAALPLCDVPLLLLA